MSSRRHRGAAEPTYDASADSLPALPDEDATSKEDVSGPTSSASSHRAARPFSISSGPAHGTSNGNADSDADPAGDATAEPKKEEDSPFQGRSKGKIAVIMFALCMAVFLAALDVTIITTALPTISEHFHSEAGYTWIGSAFLLANCASIPSWGKISDIFGRKPMLLTANIIFMVGSLVAALSDSIGMLIAARAVQGLGGGGLIILANIVIGDLFPLRVRGAFYGIIGGVWAISSAIGPIIGGAFTEYVTWRWCFYVNLPLDGCAFLILLFFLDIKTPRTPLLEGLKAIDWVGSLAIVAGTLLFLFGMQYGGETFPWDSATVVCLIVFGVVGWTLFGLWEWRFAKYPIMPLSLFAKPTNCATLAVVFFHGFVFIAGSYYLPLFFQGVLGASPILSGVYILPQAVTIAISSVGTGVLSGKFGKFLPAIYVGLFLLTLGFGLYIDLDASSSWPKIILYQVVAGLGVGPLFQAPVIALQAHIQPREIATATATLGFTRQLATSISVVIGQVVYANQLDKRAGALRKLLGATEAAKFSGDEIGANVKLIDALPAHARHVVRRDFADALQPMWIMYTCFAAAGLCACLFIKRKQLTREHVETKTGIEAERENAANRQAEKDARRAAKRGGPGGNVAAPAEALESGDDEKPRDLESGAA